MQSYQRIVSLSEYTRRWTQAYWGSNSSIIFPPVDVDFQLVAKSNSIVAVGRFCEMKRQLQMVAALDGLARKEAGNWRLTLCGNPSDFDYYSKLQNAAVQ